MVADISVFCRRKETIKNIINVFKFNEASEFLKVTPLAIHVSIQVVFGCENFEIHQEKNSIMLRVLSLRMIFRSKQANPNIRFWIYPHVFVKVISCSWIYYYLHIFVLFLFYIS